MPESFKFKNGNSNRLHGRWGRGNNKKVITTHKIMSLISHRGSGMVTQKNILTCGKGSHAKEFIT